METKEENKQSTNQNSANPTGMNIPEWVMHLLTGLGTMGAEYMLFIKPLQEKMELQSQLLKQQDERISELEAQLQNRNRKSKSSMQEEELEEDENALFQVKRKPHVVPKYQKYAQVKF